ncbi:SDR family oxidoreductase [Magnetovibrio sp.]|uniref:SDR family NAD(P)-dependent oxidoreductase n=1 Tax=Magnetovibrio sp. TaxID=2024836 RepID=UPI002F932FFB
MAQVTYDFSGKTVLVTGASRGIGLGVARGFAQAGADLHILATTDAIKTTAQNLRDETGASVAGHICDISDRTRAREVIGAFSRIDVLINNAGFERPTPILEDGDAVEATFRRIIDINVMGTYYVTREAVRKMGPGGKIVITSSIWGQTAVADMSAYCASKHANIGFMRALAQELGPKGINVNAVCPGWVKTDAAMNSLKHMATETGRDQDELLDEILSAQALDGLMEPDDMIDTYLFLASDAAANVTGQSLNVDRGELMG